MMTKIAIGIPTLGPPTWGLFDSFGKWQAYHYHEHPDITVDVIRPPREAAVDMSRSYLVMQVLEHDHDWLWFTDQDAVYQPQTLDRLLAWNKPLVGALCLMRKPEMCEPMVFKGRHKPGSDLWNVVVNEVYRYLLRYADVTTNDPQIIDPIPEGSLFAADITGCHCLLIRRDVLEAMEPPWFQGRPGREDMYFCQKAMENGVQLYIDFSTFVSHATGTRLLGVFDFMAHYLHRFYSEVDFGENRRKTDNKTKGP
jgi:hypothetical protein